MNRVLDIEQPADLISYLTHHGYVGADEALSVTVLAGGVSNRTVWVEWQSGQAWVIKQALAKLRVAVDWFSSPERIHREAAGMRTLASLLPPGSVPRLIFEDQEHHLLAMEAVPQPHSNWKTLLLNGELAKHHVEEFGRMLGTIHSRSHAQVEAVSRKFADRSFFETLRLEPYYSYTATQHAAAQDFYAALMAETRAQRIALVHGDYSPKNILVHQDRLVLLDHEVIHCGDPAFDVGFSLTHLLSKAHHVRQRREPFLQAATQYWQRYVEAAGVLRQQTGFEERAVRHTLACLLARVDGRSPLEYLSADERAAQRELVLPLMAKPPATIPQLIHCFREGLQTHAQD